MSRALSIFLDALRFALAVVAIILGTFYAHPVLRNALFDRAGLGMVR